jgi:hypothetical protein
MLPQFAVHHAVEACIDQHVSAASAAQRHISVLISLYTQEPSGMVTVSLQVRHMLISTHRAAVLLKHHITGTDEQTSGMLTHTCV